MHAIAAQQEAVMKRSRLVNVIELEVRLHAHSAS